MNFFNEALYRHISAQIPFFINTSQWPSVATQTLQKSSKTFPGHSQNNMTKFQERKTKKSSLMRQDQHKSSQ